MSFLADLHVHSHFSRATSKNCCLEGLYRWAQLKGVQVVGTGDCSHPAWLAEMEEKLVPAAPGLYQLCDEYAAAIDRDLPPSCRCPVFFMITGEISSIYKRDSRIRKVHSLILLPDLDSAKQLSKRLDAIGNIRSDGRPILGLDPRHLLEIMLEIHPDTALIPAHIWTPWFSMLGSKSGFDSAEECFGPLVSHIFAVETGLSSDPPMNWRVKSLDAFALISNSDLHSPQKLGRNANIFHCAPDYFSMLNALRSRDPAQFGGTIDLFPEEGKYHLDGHRNCKISMEPEDSLGHNCLCPVCGKPLVLGVLHRVVRLSTRPRNIRPPAALPHEYIIPLPELLGECLDVGPNSKKVARAWERLTRRFGSEMHILRELPLDKLDQTEPRVLGEAVRRMRGGQVIRRAGFDGEYGVIRVFAEGEKDQIAQQALLFQLTAPAPLSRTTQPTSLPQKNTTAPQQSSHRLAPLQPCPPEAGENGQFLLFSLNENQSDPLIANLTPEQAEAVTAAPGHLLIVAGPGTGKTRTLTHRIAWLIRQKQAEADEILAVTFTNRAANEMRQRLATLLSPSHAKAIRVGTFHAFCLQLLRGYPEKSGLPAPFQVLDDDALCDLLRTREGLSATAARTAVAERKDSLLQAETNPETAPCHALLHAEKAIDLAAIVPFAVQLLEQHPDIRRALRIRHLCIDEYQDINPVQERLLRLLAEQSDGVFAIGDPDQAIYGFRGSNRQFFEHFSQTFSAAKVIRLTTNFRSDGAIVAAAAAVMKPGRSPLSVCMQSAFEPSEVVRLHTAASPAAEAEFITHEIEQWLGGVAHFSLDTERVEHAPGDGDISFGDIAVLVRLHALIPPLAEALTRLGLPVQTPEMAAARDQAPFQQLRRALLTLAPDRHTAPAAIELQRMAQSDQLDAQALAVAEALLNDLPAPVTIQALRDRLMLRQQQDFLQADSERVTVMTLHAAKGLEFPLVFLTACEAGIIPFVRDPDTPGDFEEERRLFYVGMTRARRILTLTSARQRSFYGRSREQTPSPFLALIPADVRREIQPAGNRSGPRPATQLELDFG